MFMPNDIFVDEDDDSGSDHNGRPTTEILAMMGLDDDDLSTIANDTMNASQMNGLMGLASLGNNGSNNNPALNSPQKAGRGGVDGLYDIVPPAPRKLMYDIIGTGSGDQESDLSTIANDSINLSYYGIPSNYNEKSNTEGIMPPSKILFGSTIDTNDGAHTPEKKKSGNNSNNNGNHRHARRPTDNSNDDDDDDATQPETPPPATPPKEDDRNTSSSSPTTSDVGKRILFDTSHDYSVTDTMKFSFQSYNKNNNNNMEKKKNKKDDNDNEKKKKQDDDDGKFGMSRQFRIIAIASIVLGMALLGAIALLSLSLIQVRTDDESSSDITSSTGTPGNRPPVDHPVVDKSQPTSVTPSPTTAPAVLSPTTKVPTVAPIPFLRPPIGTYPGHTFETDAPVQTDTNMSPVETNSSLLSSEPFILDINDDISTTIDRLLDIILTVSPNSITDLNDPKTSQYQAFEWLSMDSFIYNKNMTEQKIIQRWVVGTFFLSVTSNSSIDLNVDDVLTTTTNISTMMLNNYTAGVDDFVHFGLNYTRNNMVLKLKEEEFNHWMTSTDECSWYSTKTQHQDTCNVNGEIIGIHLEELDLIGTIPTEISLLSNSLERIYLESNHLVGTIPTELGLLSNLVRLKLTQNEIQGSIPTEIGTMENLVVLGLGRNPIYGTMPSELGHLTNLRTLGFEGMYLYGTIPSELFQATDLRFISLEGNQLSGTLPEKIDDLHQLSTLLLHNNELVGDFPKGVCQNVKKTKDVNIIVDCNELIHCDCCTSCCRNCFNPTIDEEQPIDDVGNNKNNSAAATASTNTTELEFVDFSVGTETNCIPDIISDKSCYNMGEEIIVPLINCNPLQYIYYVSLYPIDEVVVSDNNNNKNNGNNNKKASVIDDTNNNNNNNMDDVMFLIPVTCPTNEEACWGIIEDEYITFYGEHDLMVEQSAAEPYEIPLWPLQKGQYRLVLIQENVNDVIPDPIIISESPNFTIKGPDDTCPL